MKRRWFALLVMLGLLLALPASAAPQVFREHTVRGDFDGANHVYATDVDGDGDTDIVGCAYLAGEIAWWENNPTGSPPPADPITWTEHTIRSGLRETGSLYATDVDGDGDTDVLGVDHPSLGEAGGDIFWWENNPSGGDPPADPIDWTEHVITTDWAGAKRVYATDVDGDGDTDVLGAAQYAAEITWWESNPSGSPPPADPISWTEHTIEHEFYQAHWVYATDLDGDGDTDVLGAASHRGIRWWENNPSGEPPPGDPISWTEHILKYPWLHASGVYAADVDGDGDTDVLGTNTWGGQIIWWENMGGEPPSFTEHILAEGFYNSNQVYATDLDGDGDTDVLSTAGQINHVTWWENEGGLPPSFTEHTIEDNYDGAVSVYATDVDGDGDTDVVGSAHRADDITWWENVTDSTGPIATSVSVSLNPIPVAELTVLSATIDDTETGNSNVAAAEWYVGDCDPDQGCAVGMAASDGDFDEPTEDVHADILGPELGVGVHTIYVRGQDAAGNWGPPSPAVLVVYDPGAGFATGGGWIIPGSPGSEPGDFLPDITGEDKANFGFVVKYKKGATTPDGQLEFHYRVGDFNLHSTEMHWMVINSNWAKFQGYATINSYPDQLFHFRVDARDGNLNGGNQEDRFILKVWYDYQDPDTDDPVYRASGDLGGGNIIIHIK